MLNAKAGRRQFLATAAALPLSIIHRPATGSVAAQGRTLEVSDYAELVAALATATAGDEIVLADGLYRGDRITVASTATADAPIRIRAADLLRATVPNGFRLMGAHTIVEGIAFDTDGPAEEQVQLGGSGNEIRRSRFRSSGGINIALHDGIGGRIMHCEFTAAVPSDDWQPSNRNIGSHYNDTTAHYDAEIGYCYFHDLPRKPAGEPYSTRGRAAIGLSHNHIRSARSTNWHIHHCSFENCGGSRFNIKTSDNLIEYCTILDSDGGSGFYGTDFNQRFGSRNIFRGCWAENCDGYRVMGGDHHFISCKSTNAGATDVFMGNQEADEIAAAYPRADRCTFTACDFPLIVGRHWSGMTLPARDTRVESHQGELTLVDDAHVGTVITSELTAMPVTALRLSRGMVGPSASG